MKVAAVDLSNISVYPSKFGYRIEHLTLHKCSKCDLFYPMKLNKETCKEMYITFEERMRRYSPANYHKASMFLADFFIDQPLEPGQIKYLISFSLRKIKSSTKRRVCGFRCIPPKK